jgi:hypothetical protein
MNDSPPQSAQGILSVYGITQTLLSLLFLVLSLLQPSETGRAVFLGQSWQRLAVSLILLLAALGAFAMLIPVRRGRGSEWALLNA